MYKLQLNPTLSKKMNQNMAQRKLAPGEMMDDLHSIGSKIFLKYCHVNDVVKKRQIFCMFKARFLAKILQLKKQGVRFELMLKVSEWIDDSEIYKKMDKSQKEKYKKEIMDHAEKLLRHKLEQRHKKKIKKLKNFVAPKMDYQKKTNFIDGSIEKDLQYFTQKSALSEYQKIKADLRKIQQLRMIKGVKTAYTCADHGKQDTCSTPKKKNTMKQES